MSASNEDNRVESPGGQPQVPQWHRIRKGQRKPYAKGTRNQIQLRLEVAACANLRK